MAAHDRLQSPATSTSTTKARAQRFLRRIGLYERLKTSSLYDLYWSLADPVVLNARRAEIDFYRGLLRGFRPGDLIFDIGANEGYKTDVFLRLGAKVVAVEPDRHSQSVLERRFRRFRVRKRPVIIDGRAVSDRDGLGTMWIEAPGSAKNTLSKKWVDVLTRDPQRFGKRLDFPARQQTETVSVETLVSRYGQPFFIKIDVEGHEPQILRGLRRPVPYLSFEVNLPEFRMEGQQCIDTLASLAEGRFNYAADCRCGLKFGQWLDRGQFLTAFNACEDRSIEVFWEAKAA